MSDAAEQQPPPEGIEDPAAAEEVEAAAWGALVALLGAAAAAIIVEGIVDLSLWPDDAWEPGAILTAIGEVYAEQFEGISADDAGQRALEWIAERENQLVRTGDAVFDQVRSRVDQALRDGVPERETAAQIAAILNPDTTELDWRARAQRIARTETHTSEQAGQDAFIDELVRSGAIEPPRFAWLWTPDERTRPGIWGGPWDHHDIEPVSWPEPFVVSGEQLRFPGDPTGSPGNVIMCRCTKVRIS